MAPVLACLITPVRLPDGGSAPGCLPALVLTGAGEPGGLGTHLEHLLSRGWAYAEPPVHLTPIPAPTSDCRRAQRADPTGAARTLPATRRHNRRVSGPPAPDTRRMVATCPPAGTAMRDHPRTHRGRARIRPSRSGRPRGQSRPDPLDNSTHRHRRPDARTARTAHPSDPMTTPHPPAAPRPPANTCPHPRRARENRCGWFSAETICMTCGRRPMDGGRLRNSLRQVVCPSMLWPIVLVGCFWSVTINLPVTLASLADAVFHSGLPGLRAARLGRGDRLRHRPAARGLHGRARPGRRGDAAVSQVRELDRATGSRRCDLRAAVAAKLARSAGLGLTARSLTGSGSALSVRGIDHRSVARHGTWPTTTSS